MNGAGIKNLGSMRLSGIAQHILFWIGVFFAYTAIYSVKTTFWIAFRNNLFYTPLHMAYYYAVASWLIPRFLFTGKYLRFTGYLLVVMFVITLLSRLLDIYVANPYIIQHLPMDDWDRIEMAKATVLSRLLDMVFFINAFKAMNMIIWVAVVIKMFKLWYERKQAALQAELNALKGQIHPHFLFNTLNNLYALTLTNSSKASQVVLGLSDLLRYMLYECNTEQVNLQKEVLMLQQYVSLEKLRYEERLDLNFYIRGDLQNKQIAPLIMLTFIENAFKHGASDTVGEAWVSIDLHVEGTRLKMKVSNSKPENAAAAAQKHHGHIGMQNVRKRLDLLYPSAHQLKVLDDEDAFLVVLELTLQTEHKPEPNLIVA
ncbi:histidine kinase [Mucilaginibacter sp. Bleaf8]|uniref:sensor histidine kinase n=1 Tax=Mucilaginibacter sp. Bleaf8 TaxID=2834430 RepID=UPI001BCDE890|nr:histidine kinase [Mucilaginibacter sp. Bleaf8]MBS7564278.1 histidine kinase [Mucilaginibacter sp. Bleaf8]